MSRLGLLLTALCGAVLVSLMIGSRSLPPGEVAHALFAQFGGPLSQSAGDLSQSAGDAGVIIWRLRVPRTLLGLLAGAALGAGGVLMQGHTRNPLADPSLLGITHGAALAIVLAIFVLGVGDVSGFIWYGFAGAAVAAVAIFLFSGVSPITLVLAGTALSWLMYSLTTTIILLDQRTFETFRFWRVGAIAGREPYIALRIAPFVLLGLILAFVNARGLNALALGDDVARSLGGNVARVRVTGLLAVVLLTGAVVAACGPIGFVGLVVPHIARALSGPDHLRVLPVAALTGATLVLFADVAGRLVAPPGELEVGIMLALVGVPFFLALIRRRRLVRL